MSRIVVSDIFGKTPALERLCQEMGGAAAIVDPYGGKEMGFQNEEQAYDFFMANTGLERFSELLCSMIERMTSPATLIGFSVGASAIWRISERLRVDRVSRAICFYGSQIRHRTEINPAIPIECILPKHEKGFSVEALAERLSGKKNVVLCKTDYLHGFMNELSINYDRAGCLDYLGQLRQKGY